MMQPRSLLYVYDALCGWCYGFSPTLRRLAEAHPELPVEVVSGGMIRGERRGPIGEVAAYIKSAYKDVERATGVRFGRAFVDGPLEEGSMYMTSEPPAALLAWARVVAPERQLDAAHALQSGIYYEGHGPGTPALARYLAEELDLDAEQAVGALTSDTYAQAAAADFALSARLGVRGFPALFLRAGDTLTPLANGYTDFDTLRSRLTAAGTH